MLLQWVERRTLIFFVLQVACPLSHRLGATYQMSCNDEFSKSTVQSIVFCCRTVSVRLTKYRLAMNYRRL